MVKHYKNIFSTVAICANSRSPKVMSIAKQCKEVLESKSIKIFYDQNFNELDSKVFIIKSEKEIIKRSDLIIAIGGDGTMLDCSRKYGAEGVPVIGINLGNLGFLTDINPDDLTSSLLKVLEGKYTLDKRFFLEVSINNEKEKYLALNEAVIHSGAVAQMIDYELFIDNNYVFSQKADGLIVSTNTGSTAYSLSGGGPIIHPKLEALCILPMFPHSLSSSPLVISSKDSIQISLKGSRSKCKLSLDSRKTIPVKKEGIISIKQSKKYLELIHLKGYSFFSAYRNKLGWGVGIVKK